jgi:hypothetical protein
MSEMFLSYQDILSVPDELCPMIALSDNIRSLFSWGIKVHSRGSYNHAMWLIRGGKFATQRLALLVSIHEDLARPWYKRLYDPLAILGQAIYCDWIQTPGLDICSDKGKYLKIVDPSYNLNHPDPEDINRWLEESGRYRVYGRYVPD